MLSLPWQGGTESVRGCIGSQCLRCLAVPFRFINPELSSLYGVVGCKSNKKFSKFFLFSQFADPAFESLHLGVVFDSSSSASLFAQLHFPVPRVISFCRTAILPDKLHHLLLNALACRGFLNPKLVSNQPLSVLRIFEFCLVVEFAVDEGHFVDIVGLPYCFGEGLLVLGH
jgi:hypothetical protein